MKIIPLLLLISLCGCACYQSPPGTTRIVWFHRAPKSDPAAMKQIAMQEKQVKSKLYGVSCQYCKSRFRSHPVKMVYFGTINPGVSGGPEHDWALYFTCPCCESSIYTHYNEPIVPSPENQPVQIVTPVTRLPAPIDSIIWELK